MARARAFLFVPLAAACLLTAGGCAPGRGAAERSTAAASASARAGGEGADLAVVAVRPGLDPDDLFLTFLEPVVDAPVLARSAGVIEEVRVREGQRVGKGQVLARLEDEEQRLEVEYTGALATQAQAELDRAEKGAAGQWISKQTLDVARAKAEATRVDLELARLAYERRTLRAPVAGVVWQVRAEPHRLAQANEVLFRVTEPGRLRADLLLPPDVARSFGPGARVELLPVSCPGAAPVEAAVRVVSPLTDPATGRVHVEVQVAHAPASLVGQSMHARLTAAAGAGDDAAAGAILPRRAYIERDGARLYVWRVTDGLAHRVAIVLGPGRPDGYEVLAGLAPGDLVCAAGASPPVEGAPVRPRIVAEATP